MCGIIGGTGLQAALSVKKSISLLTRRGPDNQSFITTKDNLTLGATRLSMVDPHIRSNQPMVDDETGNILVFNGEIYNYKSIRTQLEESGIVFKTYSDTEVLLKALNYYGSDVIAKLEGMFAFVFFNREKNNVILSRDYLGKKPLFLFADNKTFFFASEIELIRKYLNSSSLNMQSVLHFLELGYVLDPQTMFCEIEAVEPGSIVTFDLGDIQKISKRYFVPEAIKLSTEPNSAFSIQSSVLERTDGHKKFALSLSGGLDSSVIAIECARNKLPVTAYSVRWSNSDKGKYNLDSKKAETIAKLLGIEHNVVEMPAANEIPELVEIFVRAMQEPNSNPTGLSMLPLYAQIHSDGHRLTLTGDGADEILKGYPRYVIAERLQILPQFNSNMLKNILKKGVGAPTLTTKIALSFLDSTTNEYWLYWHSIINDKKLRKLLPAFSSSQPNLLGSELGQIFGVNRISNLMFKDLRTWLSMESNKKLDRIPMWYSIEARCPFQSESLIGESLSIMSKNKYKKSKRQILFDIYPELRSLPVSLEKLGFISPLGHWLRSNRNLVEDCIKNLPRFLPVEKSELKRLSSAPFRDNFNDIKILWSLIILNTWCNIYYN